MNFNLAGFKWRYGLERQEFVHGTVVEFDKDKAFGFAVCKNFNDRFLVRETEVLFPCGPYRVATDEVAKPLEPGEVIQCPLIETVGGLIALGVRNTGTIVEDFSYNNSDGDWGTSSWEGFNGFTRFIGNVQHWNYERMFGFLISDMIENQVFFQKKEVLVPYNLLADPHRAVAISFQENSTVTFDAIETPLGMRALAVKKWKSRRRNRKEA